MDFIADTKPNQEDVLIIGEKIDVDYDILEKIVDRITAEVPSVNRVCYELTKKPVATIEFE